MNAQKVSLTLISGMDTILTQVTQKGHFGASALVSVVKRRTE